MSESIAIESTEISDSRLKPSRFLLLFTSPFLSRLYVRRDAFAAVMPFTAPRSSTWYVFFHDSTMPCPLLTNNADYTACLRSPPLAFMLTIFKQVDFFALYSILYVPRKLHPLSCNVGKKFDRQEWWLLTLYKIIALTAYMVIQTNT